MTGCPIEVLLVEDSPSDAELTVEALREAKIRNNLSIEMSGRGSRFLGRLFAGRIRAAISTENRAFKTTAEASSTVAGSAS